jgi:DNA-binding response OmpR family regulator
MVPDSMESPARARVILVVDDEPDVRELLRQVLKTGGFAPLTAREGEEALSVIRHLEGRIDLVLTDVMMPVLDGATLSRRLAKDWPTLPVLFMTGYPAETLAALGFLPVETPRIEKPFEIRELLRAIRTVLSDKGPCPPASPEPG